MVNSAGLRLQLLSDFLDPSPLTENEKEPMLTHLQYSILTEAISAAFVAAEKDAFDGLPPTQKLDVIKALVAEKYFGFSDEVCTEFMLAAAIHEGNGPDIIDALANAIGTKVDRTPIVWGRPKPPTLYPMLLSRWPEEAAKIGGIAAKIPFAQSTDQLWYQNATHESLGLGGYLDFLLGRQIGFSDPTMALFIQGASIAVQTSRGEWFDEDGTAFVRLPPNVDGRSVEEVDWQVDYETRLRRREIARKSAAQRREKEIADKKARRDAAFALLANAVGWNAVVDQFSIGTFEKLRDILTSNPVGVDTAGGKTWLPTALMKQFEIARPIANAEDLEFTEQFVLTQINKRMSSWFKETQDGSLRIRKAPRVDRPVGLDRPTRSLHKHLDKLITKHGIEKVGGALLTIAGQTVSWKQLVDAIGSVGAAKAAK